MGSNPIGGTNFSNSQEVIIVGVNIYVAANTAWSFFQNNKDRLSKEMVIIAENTDTQYAVYLTEDNSLPLLSVCKGDAKPEYEECVPTETGCNEAAKRLYTQYLFPVMIVDEKKCPSGTQEEPEDLTRQDMEDAQYEREDELALALCDFLSVVLQESEDDSPEIADAYGAGFISDVLDHFLEYLALEQCLPIYRPMIITDEETGCEVYTEFPYEDDAGYPVDEDEFSGGFWDDIKGGGLK